MIIRFAPSNPAVPVLLAGGALGALWWRKQTKRRSITPARIDPNFVPAGDDITRQAGLDRGELDEAFPVLFGTASQGILVVDGKGFIVSANPMLHQLFGYAHGELIGRPLEWLIPHRLRAAHEKLHGGYVHSPRMRPMGSGLDITGLRKDGSEFPVEISLSYFHSSCGLRSVAFVSDISERKENERKLAQSHELLRSVIEGSPDPIFVKDRAGRYVLANSAALGVLGGTEEQIRGRTDRDFLSLDVARALERVDREVMRGGAPVILEESIPSNGGRHVYVTKKAPWKDKTGSVIGLIGVAHDITARRDAEEQLRTLNATLESRVQERTRQLEETNAQLEAFAQTVSHDLRAPLNGVSGFAQILVEDYKDRPLDNRGLECLRKILLLSGQMSQLIDDLLNFCQVGRCEVSRQDVDLSGAVRSLLHEFRSREPERGVEVIVEEGIHAVADPPMVRIALQNLVGNAWKFTSKRSVSRIEFGRYFREEQPVYFVRDNGAGFDMSRYPHLFEAFQRLHDASDFPGTGIGLSTVQRIIHRHGGRIWASSKPGQGATFYFTLG